MGYIFQTMTEEELIRLADIEWARPTQPESYYLEKRKKRHQYETERCAYGVHMA